MIQYRHGRQVKLFTDGTVSGSWTPLKETSFTDNSTGVMINAVLWASGSFTTDKLESGSFGGRREDYPAFREPGQAIPTGHLGSGYYVSPPSGSFLQLKDANDDIVYTTYSDGTPTPVDGGAQIESRGIGAEITFALPLYYWCSNSGESDIIRVWGEIR